MNTGIVNTRDIEMEYFSFGDGDRTLVILPGIDVKSVLTAAKAVENAYRCFAEDFTVFVFDRRKNLPSTYTIREMADDTALALEALNIKNADVFGASQGGMIAMALSIHHPSLTRSLILGSTAARKNPTLEETLATWITLAEKGDIQGLTADFVDRLYGENTIGKYRDFLIHMNDNVKKEDLDRFLILLKSLDGLDLFDSLALIRCPVFVIGAEHDRALSADASLEIAEQLGCDCYLYGDEYGHCVFDEAPDFKQRMRDFLDTV